VVALVSSLGATFGVGAVLARADQSSTVLIPSTTTTATATASTALSGESSAATNASAADYADGVYTGTVEHFRWGDVQVRVTVQGGRLVAVEMVLSPSDDRSRRINSQAQPILESEAIAAQSADIDAVSGATYTSEAYAASLQAALDAASHATSTG
jgi:uncharacterized protein with FMN-binding domain